MIAVNSRVMVRVLNGELTGTVLEVKHTTLEELNPEPIINPDKLPSAEAGIPINKQRPITLYTVQVDENSQYTGPNPLKTYNFIKEIT